jgi:hypothetical protein
VSEEDKAVPFVSPSIPPVEARIDGIIQLQDPRADVPQLLDESSSPGSIWGFELPSILTDALAPVTSFFESQDTSLAAGTTADSPKLDAIGRVTTPFGLVQQKVSAKNPEIATSSNKSEKKAPETARQSRVAYSKAAQDRAQHYLKMHITEQGEDSGKPFELFMKGTVKGPWCAGAATTVDVDIGHPFDAKKEAVWKDGRVVSVYWLMEAIKGEANSRVFSGDDFRARKLDNKILPMDYIAFAYPNGKPGAHVARFWKFTDTGFMTVDGNWDDRYGLVAHTWGDSWANRVYAVGMRFYGGESAPENKGGVKSSETPTTEKPTNTTNTDKPDEETDTQTQQVGKPVIDQPQVQIGPVPGSAVPTTFSVVPIVVGTDTTQETQETPETQVGSSNDKTVDAAVTLPAAPTEQTVEVTVPIMSTPTTTADLPDTLAES